MLISRYNFFVVLCSLLLNGSLLQSCPVSAEEDGQYRSKILVTPDENWGQQGSLSIEELEQGLGKLEDDYARSSAGRHLARHYVAQKQYDKATAFYRQALAANGLSPIANREMLRELAQVHLLAQAYQAAVLVLEQAVAIDLVPAADDYLLLARAHYELANYLALVKVLDALLNFKLTLGEAQLQRALAMYYSAGAFAQCEALLQQLLQISPQKAEHWRLLGSVYLQQNKKRAALDHLSLARRKFVPFSEEDILLLADLQAANANPLGAAATLSKALDASEVSGSGDNYRKLFQFWFQAREPQQAQEALQQAAKLTGDTQLYVYLAQLQMEQEDWPAMHATLRTACRNQLPDQFVGRANLLLGISTLKLGDRPGARRAFINASLVGGVNAQAGQWLTYMEAAAPTQDELRRVVGQCYGSQGKQQKLLAGAVKAGAVEPPSSISSDTLAIKTVPAMNLFLAEQKNTPAELIDLLGGLGLRLNVSVVKAGGRAGGAMHILFDGNAVGPQKKSAWQVGLPVSGSVAPRGRFRVEALPAYKCAHRLYEGPREGLIPALVQFAAQVDSAGYSRSGADRIVLGEGSAGSNLRLELQFGLN